MDDNEISTVKKRETLFPFIITQCVCVSIVLLTLLAVKLFFKGTYKDEKLWYEENICVDTDINEVLAGEDDEV